MSYIAYTSEKKGLMKKNEDNIVMYMYTYLFTHI